jgi:hypothetical protein
MLAHTVVAAAQSASSSYTAGQGVIALAFGALSAWRGYVRAERVEHETGRRPWGWSPTVWSVVCFFSLVIGRLCLRAAADRAARQPRLPAQQPTLPAQQPPVFAASQQAFSAQEPAVPTQQVPMAAPVSYGVTILPEH